MSYIPDPTNAAEPLNTEKAGTAAAEFRALKTYLQSSVAKLTGAVFLGNVSAPAFIGSGNGLTNLPWASVTGRPTTIVGYGITDSVATDGANATGTWNIGITGNAQTATTASVATSASLATAASSVPWAGVTGRPTTRDGYGITDVPPMNGAGASGTWGISVTGNAGTATTATAATLLANSRKINNIDFNASADIGLGSFLCHQGYGTVGFNSITYTSITTASSALASRNMSSRVAPYSGFMKISVGQVYVDLTAGTEGTGYLTIRVSVGGVAQNPDFFFKNGARGSLSTILPVTSGQAIDIVCIKTVGSGSGATYTISLAAISFEMISST